MSIARGHRHGGDGRLICDSLLFPPFVKPDGSARNLTAREVDLTAKPKVRICYVTRALTDIDRREAARQAVLIVERAFDEAATPCEWCVKQGGSNIFGGCYLDTSTMGGQCALCTYATGKNCTQRK
jgi:hypothetical protein